MVVGHVFNLIKLRHSRQVSDDSVHRKRHEGTVALSKLRTTSANCLAFTLAMWAAFGSLLGTRSLVAKCTLYLRSRLTILQCSPRAGMVRISGFITNVVLRTDDLDLFLAGGRQDFLRHDRPGTPVARHANRLLRQMAAFLVSPFAFGFGESFLGFVFGAGAAFSPCLKKHLSPLLHVPC